MFDTTISSNAANESAQVHRNALNAAFYELGLRCHWDSAMYQDVLCQSEERDCLRSYLEQHQPHLLRAYDAQFLIDAIQAAKARCLEAMSGDGCRADAHINWAEFHQSQVGV
jgi:hypothetical protein